MIAKTFTLATQGDTMPSKTYKIDWKNGRIDGFIDGADAIAQSAELAITTERYIWHTYSWDYGSDKFLSRRSPSRRYFQCTFFESCPYADVAYSYDG